MRRWLVILGLAMAQGPDIAAADPSGIPLPKPRPRASAAVTPPAAPPAGRAEALAADMIAPLMPATPRPGECATGAKRVMSAYYWEGNHTASGQKFDPLAMTAAHRTLPFGTRLTVSNPRNGKSVIVVINDRGPFVSGVSLDLSLAAAQAIGLRGTGAVCVQ
jgi:rare lipoprotein A